MKQYIYHGVMFADTIAGKDYVFVDGKIYSLPENTTKVQKMQRQKSLTEYAAGSPPPNSQVAPADADIMQPCSPRSHEVTPAAPADAVKKKGAKK